MIEPKLIDTLNRSFVAADGGGAISILKPQYTQRMTPDEALALAAWLVAMAEPFASHPFELVLATVKAT